MFTERFIRLPISLEKKNVNTNLGEDRGLIKTFIKLNPMQVESYRPSSGANDDPDLDKVTIVTKSGDSFYVNLGIEEFEKRLNNFDH